METILKIVVVVFGVILFVILFSLFAGLPLMWLWNWVGVDVLGLRPITFWQAVGLLFLSGLLFKSSSTTKKD